MDEQAQAQILAQVEGDAFLALFAQNPLPMWIYDLETLAFLDVNQAAVDRYGYSRDEFLRMRITDIRPSEDVPRLVDDVQRERPSLEYSKGWRHLTKSGEIIDVDITSHTLQFAGRPAVLVVVHDMTERKEAQAKIAGQMEAMAKRATEFAVLLEISKDLAAEHDLSSLLEVIVDRAVGLTGASGGFIYLYDAVRHDLEAVVIEGVPVPPGTRLNLGEGLAGTVAQTREARIVDRYQEWEGRAARFAGLPVTSVAEVPMLYRGELVGVLGVAELDGGRTFNDETIRLLSLLTAHAAAAVNQTRLYTQTQTRMQRLGALRTIDMAITASLDLRVTLSVFLDQVTGHLGVDAADILLLNPRTQILEYAVGRGFRTSATSRTRLRLGQGHAGRAALDRRTVPVPHLAVGDPGRPFLEGEEVHTRTTRHR